jgi:hypothetical protein
VKGRIFFISILVCIFSAIHSGADAGDEVRSIVVNGSSHVVDVDDILSRNNKKLSNSDIKRICAEITDRYHQRGYTAFYIKKAVQNDDGIVELFFNESVVTDIVVTGVTQRSDEVAASVFPRGDMFNEYILKDNVSEIKKKFNIKQLNISIKRSKGGDIIITAHAVERINEIETGIFNSPVYGILPGLAYRINYGGFLAGISASSSFNQNERSYSRGSFLFNSDSIPGNSYFTLRADVTDKKDSFIESDDLIYRHRSFSTGGGYSFNRGPSGIMFLLTGTMDKLTDYPGQNDGVSFSGFHLKLYYNDMFNKIDYEDITSFEAGFSYGWNFIEHRPSSKFAAAYIVNFPLYSGIFFSLNGNCFYTSDKERFSHFYVYDKFLPCRDDDFSSASWRSVAGADIVYEAVKRTFFIAPCFKWGLHNSGERIRNVYAPGIKSTVHAGKVKIEISWLYDAEDTMRDGFVLFSAAAVY